MASHRLLQAFRSSKPAFGAWLTIPSTWVARTTAAASSNITWLVIDCEHGLIPLQPGASDIVAAVAGLGSNAPSVLVRIPATGPCADGSATWQIKYVLDAGAKGIIVPMVSTAAQARSVVAAARFPPKGNRGFGNPFTHLSWGLSPLEYLQQANDNIVVLTQVETRQACENIEELCTIDGLDGFFIGPYDLSLSLGFPPPNPDPHPEVEETLLSILDAAHKAGKKCAMFCTSGRQAAQRAEQGFDMINVTSDSGALTDGVRSQFATAAGEDTPQGGFGY
ncbi:Phosphoenolpyruvate/pyruvate domain-containing protein [Irpex rosettiformis]|uniref:Phosphoenolpyruvate/pyruvate domain-containing protein n=1 Tax=Irpex rosettiformis TaxID=378272 RepID=A0ACB8U338_9APHY|nr:Phosphoenolpyruvate/pyruvate domain-containing protein [Irpex rosettiformis]